MLVLTRRPGESIILEIPNLDPVNITMFENGRIGIDAPDEVQIIREELLAIQQTERTALVANLMAC